MKFTLLIGLRMASMLVLLIPAVQGRLCVKTCVMPKNQTVVGGDDSPVILEAINDCGNNSRVVFEEGVTYNLFTPWKLANINNIEFVFKGNLTLSTNVTDIQSVVRNSRIFPGQWIQIRGDQITFTGSQKADGGWFICKTSFKVLDNSHSNHAKTMHRPWRFVVGHQ